MDTRQRYKNVNQARKVAGKVKGFLNSQTVEKLSNQKMAILVGIFIFVLVFGGILLFRHDRQRAAETIQSPTVMAEDMPGWWYKEYFGSSVCDKEACKSESDPDGDKLTNAQEFYYNSNPVKADTNGNGKTDGQDVAAGIDPSKPGDMTFDEALSEDQIFGESMVYADTLKQEFTNFVNPNKIQIKLAADAELTTIDDNSDQAKIDYMLSVRQVINKYFDPDTISYISSVAASQEPDGISDIQVRSLKTHQELKGIKIPSKFLTLHKYLMRYFELFAQIIKAPSQASLQNTYDPVSSLWSDNVKEWLVLYDRAQLEQKKLGITIPTTTDSNTQEGQ